MKNECPSCRKEITVTPTVNWSLKSLIDRSLNQSIKVTDLSTTTHEVTRVEDGKILEDLHSDLNKISAAYFEKENLTNLCLKMPMLKNIESRRHVSFVCLIDVSGSMDEVVGAAEGGKAFTRLDLVKHVLNVLVASLNDNDQMSLITFSDDSEIILDLVNMTQGNKTFAKSFIQSLRTIGGTNTLPGRLLNEMQTKNKPWVTNY